jgi:hypothetical protein
LLERSRRWSLGVDRRDDRNMVELPIDVAAALTLGWSP